MELSELKKIQIQASNTLDPNDYPKAVYECDMCKDSGFVVTTEEDAEIVDSDILTLEPIFKKKCKCRIMKDYQYRMTLGGMDQFLGYTFDNYLTKFEWQKNYKQLAMNFRVKPTQMFFMSGGTGSGKTRLCSTLCNYLVYKGYHLEYMLWENEMAKATDNYRAVDFKKFELWTTIPLLYIDDFLKCVDNDISTLTDLEKRTARAIINARYLNPKLITIISTELTDVQLDKVDKSLFRRFKDMATKDYLITMNPTEKRNISDLKFLGEWD